MSILAGMFRWCDRWLNNGANLITLSRIPVLLFILGPIYAFRYELPSWYPLLLGASLLGIFWQGAIAQFIGMVADGVDGWWARHMSRVGATSEGQFLDQFIDKIFIWVVWWALSLLFYLDTWWMILYWWMPSLYLFYLDCRSCLKHWRTYKSDRGKKVNPESGAVMRGKIKFGFENVVVVLNLAAICPYTGPDLINWYDGPTLVLYYLGLWAQPFSFAFILVAISLARGSLRQRGVLPPKKGDEKKHPRPDRFAEALH